MSKNLLSAVEFADVVRLAPLVSIDLILRNDNNEVLLGVRNNQPAKGFRFVPGGRILKDERLTDAFKRITLNETGFAAEIGAARFKGVYEHLYDDNFGDFPGFGTHYVVLAHELRYPFAEVKLDSQHSAFEWWDEDRIRASSEVHDNTKAYFLD